MEHEKNPDSILENEFPVKDVEVLEQRTIFKSGKW
jgi:hypothetical protein